MLEAFRTADLDRRFAELRIRAYLDPLGNTPAEPGPYTFKQTISCPHCYEDLELSKLRHDFDVWHDLFKK